MLECHYSLPAREKIAQMQKSGATDQTIVDSFVKESGLSALASPPAAGIQSAWLGNAVHRSSLRIGCRHVWFKRFIAQKTRHNSGTAGDRSKISGPHG